MRRSALVLAVTALAVAALASLRAAPASADQAVSIAVPPPLPPPLPPRPPHRRPPCPPRPWRPLSVPDAPRGRLTLTTRAFAEVSIDGRLVGHTPLVGFHLDPGSHHVVLRASCGTLRKTVFVSPATDTYLALAMCGQAPVLR